MSAGSPIDESTPFTIFRISDSIWCRDKCFRWTETTEHSCSLEKILEEKTNIFVDLFLLRFIMFFHLFNNMARAFWSWQILAIVEVIIDGFGRSKETVLRHCVKEKTNLGGSIIESFVVWRNGSGWSFSDRSKIQYVFCSLEYCAKIPWRNFPRRQPIDLGWPVDQKGQWWKSFKTKKNSEVNTLRLLLIIRVTAKLVSPIFKLKEKDHQYVRKNLCDKLARCPIHLDSLEFSRYHLT